MLNINTRHKYSNLYRLVNNITEAVTEQSLDFNLGVYHGWSNAKLLSHWTVQEIGRVDMLVESIVESKRKQFEEK